MKEVMASINSKLLIFNNIDNEKLNSFINDKKVIAYVTISERTSERIHITDEKNVFTMQEPYINIECEEMNSIKIFSSKYPKYLIDFYSRYIFDTTVKMSLDNIKSEDSDDANDQHFIVFATSNVSSKDMKIVINNLLYILEKYHDYIPDHELVFILSNNDYRVKKKKKQKKNKVPFRVV